MGVCEVGFGDCDLVAVYCGYFWVWCAVGGLAVFVGVDYWLFMLVWVGV